MTFAAAPSDSIDALLAVFILALAHLLATEMHRMRGTARDAFLTAGAGVALAYVPLYILPRLAAKQADLAASLETGVLGFMATHVYLLVLVGMVIYYGIARLAAGGGRTGPGERTLRERASFMLTVVSYAAYSVLIGYLSVHRLHSALATLILITVAMGTYFLVSDYGLRHKWPNAYDRVVRWVLAAAVLAGWGLGVKIQITENAVALWFSFLAGVLLMDTLREKLSHPGRGSFWAFLVGVVGFSAMVFAFRLSTRF